MYHGIHESFQGNLIIGGQWTFTIHQRQFSMHGKQQDRQWKVLGRCVGVLKETKK